MKKFVFGVAVLLLAITFGSTRAGAGTPPIAIVNSGNSASYFGQHYGFCSAGGPGDANALGITEYERYYKGWKYVLHTDMGMVEGTDFMEIGDSYDTYDQLKDFQIIILSNSPSLSKAQDSAIQTWVQRGGKLIATFGSGYEGIISATQAFVDDAKLKKGGTNGLHNLWKDPLTKAVSTGDTFGDSPIAPGCFAAGSVETALTAPFEGPTAHLMEECPYADTSCSHIYTNSLIANYGRLGNMLTQRPLEHHTVFGYFLFSNNLAFYDPSSVCADTDWKKPLPAIVASKVSKGYAVYLASAPEFIVSLEFDLAGHCDGTKGGLTTDPNYPAGPSPVTPNDFDGRSYQLRALMRSVLRHVMEDIN
jgi:hypothetical protein